jgi:hypothetical protein
MSKGIADVSDDVEITSHLFVINPESMAGGDFLAECSEGPSI